MSVEANGDNRHWRHHGKCPETDRKNQKKLQLFAFTGLEHKFKPKLKSADKSKLSLFTFERHGLKSTEAKLYFVIK